jgi:response regulator NasT
MNNSAVKSSPAAQEVFSVVVADDNRSMAELLATNLRRLGHRVVGIGWNGKEAVALVLKHRPDLLVMDVEMPHLDGINAAREILSHVTMPIVLSTGRSDESTVERALDLNVVSYLVKPYSPAQLRVAIQMAVAQCREVTNAAAASTHA